MRYLYLLALVACFSLVACKEKSKFIINGIGDIKVMRDSLFILPLAIAQESGEQERVNLSVSGMPAKVEYNFEPGSGTPDFGTFLRIKAKYNAVPGTYPIKITGTNAAGYKKEYELNLTIDNNEVCRVGLYGTWVYALREGTSCSMPHTTMEISRDLLHDKNIQIKHYYSKDNIGSMLVNCNGTLTDNQFSSGTFNDSVIVLTHQSWGGTCRYTFLKQ